MEEVREHLQVWDMKEGCREKIVTAVKKKMFHWCIVTADIDEEHAQNVLDIPTE